MAWLEQVILNIAERKNLNNDGLFEKVLNDIISIFDEIYASEHENKHQVLWELLVEAESFDDERTIEELKVSLLSIVKNHCAQEDDYDWNDICQRFNIDFDQLIDEYEPSLSVEELECLVDLFKNINHESMEPLDKQEFLINRRNLYAQSFASLCKTYGLLSSPEHFKNIDVGKEEELYEVARFTAELDVDESTKKRMLQIFEKLIQLDLYPIINTWDYFVTKFIQDDYSQIFNDFFNDDFFTHKDFKLIIKHLINNDVLADVNWLQDNVDILNEDDPIQAINYRLANTDDEEFNQKLKDIFTIGKDNGVKLYIGQLKYFYPHYVESFNELYQEVKSDDEQTKLEGLRGLKYAQQVAFHLKSDTYYQKCCNFFNNIDLNNFFDSTGTNLGSIEIDYFFDSKTPGSDETGWIYELLSRRLKSNVHNIPFSIITYGELNFQPSLAAVYLEQDDELNEELEGGLFTNDDLKHQTSIRQLIMRYNLDDIDEINWDQDNLTFLYNYLTQHITGVKNSNHWDDLNLDNCIERISTLESEDEKINIVVALSLFHVYLIEKNKDVNAEKMEMALDALFAFKDNPLQNRASLIQIRDICPDFINYLSRDQESKSIIRRNTQLFKSSIKASFEFIKLDEFQQQNARNLINNFNDFMQDSPEFVRYTDIEKTKELICKILMNEELSNVRSPSIFNQWLRQLHNEHPFQFASFRAKLILKDSLEELDEAQKERYDGIIKKLNFNMEPLESISTQDVENAYREIYAAVSDPDYVDFQDYQEDTPYIIQLAQSYVAKPQLPQQEKYARLALAKISDAIFQVDNQLGTSNPYALSKFGIGKNAATNETYIDENEQQHTRWVTPTMRKMLEIIDMARQGKMTARSAYALVEAQANKACVKYAIGDGEEFENPQTGEERKKAFYFKVKRGDFVQDKALLKKEQLCKNYCLQLKNEIENTPWAIAFGVGKTVRGNRISPTMIKMREAIKDAEKGRISWESAYHYIHDKAFSAKNRRSSPRVEINLFSKGKTNPNELYNKITNCRLLCSADQSIIDLLDKVGEALQDILDKPQLGPKGLIKALNAFFGGKEITFKFKKDENDNNKASTYNHRPEHIVQAAKYYNEYKEERIDPRLALDNIRKIFQKASVQTAWYSSTAKPTMRTAGTHGFYQHQARTLSLDLEEAGKYTPTT